MIYHHLRGAERRGYGTLGAFQLIPPVLVGAARQALRAQGIDPSVINDDGAVDAANLLSLAFDEVEIRTAASPPVKFSIAGPPDPETDALLRELQPAVVLTGRAGTARIAPYGVPGGISGTFKTAGIQLGVGALLAAIAGVIIIRSL